MEVTMQTWLSEKLKTFQEALLSAHPQRLETYTNLDQRLRDSDPT